MNQPTAKRMPKSKWVQLLLLAGCMLNTSEKILAPIQISEYSIHPECSPQFAMTTSCYTMLHRKKSIRRPAGPFMFLFAPWGPCAELLTVLLKLFGISVSHLQMRICSVESAPQPELSGKTHRIHHVKLSCPSSLCLPSAISHHLFIKDKASATAKTQTWTSDAIATGALQYRWNSSTL